MLLGAVLSRGADGLGIRDVILAVGGGAYLVDVVRRVAFVARGVWGLEFGSRVGEDVEIGWREIVEGIEAVGIGGCALRCWEFEVEGEEDAGWVGVNIASCTDQFLATSSPFCDFTFSFSSTSSSPNNCVANTLLILVQASRVPIFIV